MTHDNPRSVKHVGSPVTDGYNPACNCTDCTYVRNSNAISADNPRYVILPPSHLNERVTAFLDSAAWQIAKGINPHANGNDWGTVRSTLDRMYDDLVGTFSERPYAR